jgi:hypothetical protein
VRRRAPPRRAPGAGRHGPPRAVGLTQLLLLRPATFMLLLPSLAPPRCSESSAEGAHWTPGERGWTLSRCLQPKAWAPL